MRRSFQLMLLALLPLGPVAAAPAKVVADPFQAPAPLVQELNPDIIFNVLAGEVASHHHQLEQAFRYYREAALETGDPQLAERAARLALFNKDQKALEEIVDFWVTRDPNSLEARRFALAVALEQGRDKEAKEQLSSLIKLASAKGVDGFILAARALGKSKGEQRALDLMEGLAKAHAEDRNAWYAFALLASEFKDFKRAEQGLERLQAKHADWDKANLLRAQVLIAQQRGDQAEELLRKAVLADADNAELRHAYARLLVQDEKFQAAYDQFNKLLEKNPDAVALRYVLGVLSMELKHYDEAAGHFEQIKDSRVRRNEASYYLGRIAEERKQPDQALDWYRRVRGGEFELQARLKIADLLAKQGKLEQARDELRGAREQWEAHSVGIYVAESAILREVKADPAMIWRLFEEALAEHPDNPDLLYARALFAAGQRRVDVLEKDLRKVLEQNPKHADALNALGYTLADMTDRLQEALGYIGQALELKPDSPAILDSMGWVQFRLGNHAKALEYLQRAAEKVVDPEINSHLGEVLWVDGRQDEAREVWRKALDEFPDSDLLRDTLKRLGVESK